MLKFIPASELKKSYQVNGHFYTVTLENKEFLEEYSALKLKVEDMKIVTEEYLKTVFILSKSSFLQNSVIFRLKQEITP